MSINRTRLRALLKKAEKRTILESIFLERQVARLPGTPSPRQLAKQDREERRARAKADKQDREERRARERADKAKKREIPASDGPHYVISAPGGNKVFMGNYTVKHLKTHAVTGKGSVFNTSINPGDISNAISTIPDSFFTAGGGAKEINVSNAGFDLVQKTSEIRSNYPDAKEIKIQKQEGVELGEDGKPKKGADGKNIPKMVTVTALVVDAGKDLFKTNTMTVVIRPANPNFMPEEAKNDDEISSALKNGKAFAILTAFPGKSDIPKASEWGDDYAVIVPDGGKGADADVQKQLKSLGKPNEKATSESNLRGGKVIVERWQKLAGIIR